MKKVALIVLALALVAPATAQASSWKKFAQANDSSEYYASASVSTKVKGARQVRIIYAGTGTMEIDGSVSCFGSGFSYESRDFSFFVKKGQRTLPLPLKNAECSYFVTATLADGGGVAFALYRWR